MALMPGLQINIGQQLKLTPQLQQSIKILQYSALEVQQTISTTLETNFMLELDEDGSEEAEEFDADDSEYDEEPLSEASDVETELDIEASDTLSDDLQADYEWEEVYIDSPITNSIKSNNNDDYTAPENYTSAEVTLSEKLYWQSDIYSWSGSEELIASYIIDDIDDEGYLKAPLEDIMASIQKNEPDLMVSVPDIEKVLAVIQQFEPTGVAARDLSECLILQLKALHQNPYVVTAIKIIEENFDLLSVRDYKRIKKIYLLNDDELMEVIHVIQALSPRPGREYSSTQGEIVIPDLKLYRSKEGFIVELNQDAFPRLTINSAYIDMAGSLGTDSSDSKQIKEQLVEAKGLIKSIQSRGETLLRVGKYIIEKQARFFEEGEQAMQPMVLRDVAESLDLHESTISRATNQKYMQTPRGTFELKYFFSTGVSQYGSEDQSAIAIKSHIKQLIENEDPNKPLSDNKLMALLEEKEINVARRTIAKYREALHIPSSSERKKMNKFK
ncbi:RNA polymerase factor sigma-54 [Hydrogenovibrio sp. 3SP14C1]|uniref:RNA polymerase factor sigma-54 n=1 Tax=Hydrogenovibrio sp. 3SP14C1 TaxID=3038774 RepID=UPI0024160A0B|nr:RNA polymerase factor sigma-54 [Hydrogenovibrio sp. 3SP14C1]MDG4812740.1 RNA polymerase factor sigma-54 [Hydrogenovibrio sp. 3SP14C1]